MCTHLEEIQEPPPSPQHLPWPHSQGLLTCPGCSTPTLHCCCPNTELGSRQQQHCVCIQSPPGCCCWALCIHTDLVCLANRAGVCKADRWGLLSSSPGKQVETHEVTHRKMQNLSRAGMIIRFGQMLEEKEIHSSFPQQHLQRWELRRTEFHYQGFSQPPPLEAPLTAK